MADDKKPTPKAVKTYRVIFTAIQDKGGNLRRQGETVTADELTDPEFQLRIGAIVEVEK
jgi:hypothetical protein